MPDNIIVAAVADSNAHSVTVTWENGETFRPLIGKSLFAALADPTIFARVQIGERGRSLAWPGEVDVCADALWFEVHARRREHATS